ncbi:hypothetical protein DFH09DRAFT_1314059 [Mycena vulgaris]|nr:hypothetical protein DFH09DRAFT_1314059 [Mycena vulgaris]
MTVDRLTTTYFLKALGPCLPGEYLFPNLEKLFCFSYRKAAFHHVRLLLAPRIANLHTGYIATNSQLSILSTLAATHPSLKKLAISSTISDNLLVPAISTVLCRSMCRPLIRQAFTHT